MFIRQQVALPRRRKKGKFRLFATSALIVGSSLATRPAPVHAQSAPAVRPAGEMRFDIPAGPLATVLRAFEAASGLTITVALPADTVQMMQSPGVAGVFTIHNLLRKWAEL